MLLELVYPETEVNISSETSVPVYHFTQRNIAKPWTFVNTAVRK